MSAPETPDPLGAIWQTFFGGLGMPGAGVPPPLPEPPPPPPPPPEMEIHIEDPDSPDPPPEPPEAGDDSPVEIHDDPPPPGGGGGYGWIDDELADWLDWLDFGGPMPYGCGFWTFVALLVLVLGGGAVTAIAVTSGGSPPITESTSTLPTTTTIPVTIGNPFAGYYCHGAKQLVLIDNSNANEVANGGSAPTFSTNGQPYCVTYIQTYHWNGGSGSAPGSVGLTHVGGGPAGLVKTIGPFTAKASSGQNNAPNVNWYADVPLASVIIDGSYACSDSEPSTWSADAASGGDGFCIVYAYHAYPPAGATTTIGG